MDCKKCPSCKQIKALSEYWKGCACSFNSYPLPDYSGRTLSEGLQRKGKSIDERGLGKKMIRVFPRKTKWTPDDDLAFVGDPGLFRPATQPVKISCTFTWDIQEAERLYRAWSEYYPDVEIGGPAFGDTGDDFTPGLFVKNGVVITSRGCTKDCSWCFVPKREGWIKELPVVDGWDVADNNLLACSSSHIRAVFDMLKRQPEPIRFSGGLDAEMLQAWHVELLKGIRLKFAWFACDYPGAIRNLERVADLMGDFSREKKRCYVLIGFNGETPPQAERRLEAVYKLDFLPMAMLYRDEQTTTPFVAKDWQKLRRTWSRPAAYKSKMANKSLIADGKAGIRVAGRTS